MTTINEFEQQLTLAQETILDHYPTVVLVIDYYNDQGEKEEKIPELNFFGTQASFLPVFDGSNTREQNWEIKNHALVMGEKDEDGSVVATDNVLLKICNDAALQLCKNMKLGVYVDQMICRS